MSEQKVLIAMPVDYPGYVVPGSLRWICHECRRGVWIAPSSWLIMHDNPGMEVLCWACVAARMEKEPSEMMELTPAQAEEIEEYRKSRSHGSKEAW